MRLLHWLSLLPHLLVTLILVCGVFFPSYSNPPIRYEELRERVRTCNVTGAANVNNEKIFIAASLYDKNGELLSGHWGDSVQRLVSILGPENVFLSIYENDPDVVALQALKDFHAALPCNSSLVHEHLNTSSFPQTILPSNGETRLRRIPFLAEVRNRALAPLTNLSSPASSTKWDKLLYLNDIAFDPLDAANLLFSTNLNEITGRTDYRAACAVDFINPFKFYDTFATRDTEGYDMGVPFYPWFTTAGKGVSRGDVIGQRDAVRVRSCWGGMVAFEGRWFQPGLYQGVDEHVVEDATLGRPSSKDYPSSEGSSALVPATSTTSSNPSRPPLRFSAPTEAFWDASECCLIHADLAALLPISSSPGRDQDDIGIYLNPFIRISYSPTVLPWLALTRRFERLYPMVHSLVNVIAGRPSHNPRQNEMSGEIVREKAWRWDDAVLGNRTDGLVEGRWVEVERVAGPGGFCGKIGETYFKSAEEMVGGGKVWGDVRVPDGWL